MLNWNTPTTNQRTRKRESETYGLTHPFINPFQQALQRYSFNRQQNISKEAKNFTKFSSAIQLKSATVAWTTCQKSLKDIIKKVTSEPRDQRPKRNSRKKAECPMEESCQVNNVVYKCDVTRPLPKKVYLRLAEGEWNSRFYNHKLSFKHKRYSTKTTLSSYIWHLKRVSSETKFFNWNT